MRLCLNMDKRWPVFSMVSMQSQFSSHHSFVFVSVMSKCQCFYVPHLVIWLCDVVFYKFWRLMSAACFCSLLPWDSCPWDGCALSPRHNWEALVSEAELETMQLMVFANAPFSEARKPTDVPSFSNGTACNAISEFSVSHVHPLLWEKLLKRVFLVRARQFYLSFGFLTR